MALLVISVVAVGWGVVQSLATLAPDRVTRPAPVMGAREFVRWLAGIKGKDDVRVRIDTQREMRPINPYVYGVSRSEGALPHFKDMGVSVVRWGGNARTRFNWEVNASNTGADWAFRNVPKGDDMPGSAGVAFHRANRLVGADSLLTIPMIGWVARDQGESTGGRALPRPETGRAPSDSAGVLAPPAAPRDGDRNSVRSYARKGLGFQYPPDRQDGVVYQDEWVSYLTRTLGPAEGGGIRVFEMDNEPMLWHVTHADVRPEPLGYGEYLNLFLDYSNAVKDVDPTVWIAGPSEWGWSSYFRSASDQRNGIWGLTSDWSRYGGTPFIPWFLQSVRAHDAAQGRRSLDMLSVHYYPEGGVHSSRTDGTINARRLRSTRSLWDPIYRDESWIGRTTEPNVRLIPRLREWIDEYYPGTKLGITEWSWGAPDHLTGGLAVADVLGIFGREGVDLATYWGIPERGSPVYWAFRMYRNYDGEGHGFGDFSLPATNTQPDAISSHASYDSRTGEVKVLLINKSPRQTVRARLTMPRLSTGARAICYRYSAEEPQIVREVPSPELTGGDLSCDLPPYSITLLVAPLSELLEIGGRGE